MRWDPYMLFEGLTFDQFWKDHLSKSTRNVLFVVGRGFDVRALDAPRRIMHCGGNGCRKLWILCFDNGRSETEEHAKMTAANMTQLKKLFSTADIEEVPLKIIGSGQQSITSRNTVRALSCPNKIKAYTDIVIDVSAMPRMIAITAIAKLIRLLDDIFKDDKIDVNLHVVTAESVISDYSATGGSLSEKVTNVVGFSGRLNSQVDEHVPRVWFPVLGEGQGERLTLIREELRPDEICPVIPFPSREPRRGDQIIDSYRQILFDDFQIEPLNILHACEFNPFEAYKQLYSAIGRYSDSLRELGGCRAFVSPLSSKLLSVGALLACYDHAFKARPHGERELFVGIPYVESVSYRASNQSNNIERELYSMWIRGEWER